MSPEFFSIQISNKYIIRNNPAQESPAEGEQGLESRLGTGNPEEGASACI